MTEEAELRIEAMKLSMALCGKSGNEVMVLRAAQLIYQFLDRGDAPEPGSQSVIMACSGAWVSGE